MRFRIRHALCTGLILSSAPTARGGTDEDLARAKTYLKESLKQVNRKYPFSDWEKQAAQCRSNLDRLRAKPGFSGGEFDRGAHPQLESMEREIQDLSKHKADADRLVKELYVSSLVSRIDGMFFESGKRWDPDAKLSFQRSLMQYESGSLKPKTAFLANVAGLERDFRKLQTDWQYAFAQDFLGRRVEDHLRAHNLAKIEGLYDDYSLQLDYWNRQLQDNASQTGEQLESLSRKFEENKTWLKQDLESLGEALNTDFLFSDLLEYARKQKVDFTIEVEDKIEASLKERNQSTLAPIQERIALWKTFSSVLKERIGQAAALARNQQSQALARAEDERMERERMEALKREQQRMEKEQKEKFKQTLSALKTFSFKTETTVELDDDSKKALGAKSGFLKTSYVRSGLNKLKVDKARFNDTLALVQKFSIEEGQVDFSKMSLQERSNQSAYTYASPAGRTSQGDLENFVAEVALGSFSTHYRFLSFVMPSRWSPGKRVTWMADRVRDKEAQDREFSYVDMVVDAHRKRTGGSTRTESTVNIPANMIVIFDPRGAIIRYESFAEVGQVFIQGGDLVGGKLYYKFLNYSTDRRHIYLNGIDPEMKVAEPGGKS
ncbi:MAG TPA: hypothetical protein VJ385_08070 [Fibrobacteria bacterium]|nr:hypothetical protein [Fibrobacteria bacterium]